MMVINRGEMNKRKRKDDCRNIFLDESPKRTKVHAQRKFAQGSSMSSPVITPIKEIERQERTKTPEPAAELLPIKRPNTEDFLTFLCFRGTPILPQNLDFFNKATETKTKSSDSVKEAKNGPIATATITKAADGREEKPFIAFGVRKRADPVVISKQMDKKRRHALAVQALRRKYQEQRMAKIRAVTISNLSEKPPQKPLIRTTRSVTKNETITKKINPLPTTTTTTPSTSTTTEQQIKPPKKPIPINAKTKIKPKMCLRSFRGRFIHHELNFKRVKKKTVTTNASKLVKKKQQQQKSQQEVKKKEHSSDFSSDDDQPLVKRVSGKSSGGGGRPQVAKKSAKKSIEVNFRLTRSSYASSSKMNVRRHHLRQRLLQQKKAANSKATSTLRILQKGNLRKLTEKEKQQHAKKQALVQELRNRSVFKKEEEKVSPKKVEINPKKVATKPDEPAVTQRPTRKTKEAAAIYMEILGHKLVSEGKNDDDDNVSIDSFPELPNVRKTEQRENELKARAKVDGGRKVVEKRAINKNDEQKIVITRNKSQLLQSETNTKISPISEAKTTRSRNRRSELEAIKTSMLKAYDSSSDESDQDSTKKPVEIKDKLIVKIEKLENNFNDSDEEPLSKLTVPSSVTSKKDETTIKKPIEKTKRECTKKSQSYLFSSSDDDEKCFHGFVKHHNKNEMPVVASADLLRRDVGRRFGKGKVNMSNEQIEKWLKDSELAGGGIDDEECMKYGEKIPTETTQDLNLLRAINTEGLKTSLLRNAEEKTDVKLAIKENQQLPLKMETPKKQPILLPKKPLSNDRKLIFRKAKQTVPNANAFSASNESSVYAFGEENEDAISTPFRRPMRRPSSTATSKSEDDSCKQDDSNKSSGRFRVPINKPFTAVSSNANKQEIATQESQVVVVGQESHGSEMFRALESSDATQTETSDSEQPFYMPHQPLKPTKSIETPSTSTQKRQMCPPVCTLQKPKTNSSENKTNTKSTTDAVTEKIPSSPSAASSSSSAKICNRRSTKMRGTFEIAAPLNLIDFPAVEGPAQIVEAPTFHPNEREFQDPIEYIEKIRARAERFGICRIVPPACFKPECKVADDMRFTAYNQYVHKMLHRWGPNFKELMAIRKYLETQNITMTHPPWIGGMEIDLPRLYQTVQSLGGLKEVIEKKKWPKVSEIMRIPKSAQDRVTKLDDIYCKYLLPYDTLSPVEREKLFDEVETEWAKRESKSLLKSQEKIGNPTTTTATDSDSESDNEAEECIVKGRNMALNAFYRIARNTMSMWFRNAEPTAQEVEQEFWKHVTLKQNHICVHSGSIDSGSWGYGFAVSKNSPFARHAWNLKVLTNNSGSVLRSMGPIMGVTVPTLHVGMVFTACCWYRDPHHLPWIEYLHAGANKIWYAVPDSMSQLFHTKLLKLVPNYCRNKSLWLPSDTAMVPPNLLVENGVSLCRTVQQPGEYVIVFPKAFTCSLSTGYVVSESVYFAPPQWLVTAEKAFDELRNSCEPSMFSLDRLLLSIVMDSRSSVEVLKLIVPAVEMLCAKERDGRERLRKVGVNGSERVALPEVVKKKKKLQDDDYECEICRKNLFVTMVSESQEDGIYCSEHAIELITEQKIQSKHCKLLYTYDDVELGGMVEKLKSAIESKSQKKVPNKFAGMPTLLNK